ncbi:MAG: 16S rRNA (cytosine(967)-C(5))-methyltransferase RsmB [Lachnospiraceae bacterium]|nr:16S rRNA (cytosine(967)-C(5))-methyltransferase RsmB [Lachnospiraceae bacterium]
MREFVYEVVWETMEKGKNSDRCLHAIWEREQALTAKQRSYMKRLSYGTIERCIELDAVLNRFSKVPVSRMESSVRTVLRMALYELRYMEQAPDAAVCNEAVNLIRKEDGSRYAGFVNGILRNYLRKKDETEPKEDWVKYSIPKPLMDHLSGQYGKKTAKKIAAAFLERESGITLHINTNRISLEEYIALLTEKEIVSEPGIYMEDALRVFGVQDVALLPGYDEGLFFVQDESSMLPARCAGIHPGDTVVDLCSAPGGKALHALQLLGGSGLLSARDVSAKKMKQIQENISRMGYENVECKVWDGTITDEEWKERADVILADVPCSGIGIIGRKPEIKYRALEQADTLAALQRKICQASVGMLKRGGVFLYSTCTINRKENEENVVWLEEHCDLKRSSLDEFLPETLKNKMTKEGMLQMLPGLQKSDGFFVARLIKR